MSTYLCTKDAKQVSSENFVCLLSNVYLHSFNMGVAFVVVASLLTIGGIVLIILICTGVCGTKTQRNQPTQVHYCNHGNVYTYMYYTVCVPFILYASFSVGEFLTIVEPQPNCNPGITSLRNKTKYMYMICYNIE